MDDKFNELANILEEYTFRLQKLYKDYNEYRKMKQRKKSLLFSVFSVLSLLVAVISLILPNLDFSTAKSNLFFPFSLLLAGLATAATIYFYLLNTPDFDKREVIDEMTLLNSQLLDIVMRASQTFEHNKESDLKNYRIRLKIIEAEDILKKTQKVIE